MEDLHGLAGTYRIDPAQSRVGFLTRHAMITRVRGDFSDVSGEARTGRNLVGAQVEVDIGVASIDTGNAERDGHLRSEDFFDVAHHPLITFRSALVEATSASILCLTGDLTVRDVTRRLTVYFDYVGAVRDPDGTPRIGFQGQVVVGRKDFGLTWNAVLETGGLLLAEHVTLDFEVSAVRVG